RSRLSDNFYGAAGFDQENQSCARADEPILASADYFGDVDCDHGGVRPGPCDRQSWDRKRGGFEGSGHRVSTTPENDARICRDFTALSEWGDGELSWRNVPG